MTVEFTTADQGTDTGAARFIHSVSPGHDGPDGLSGRDRAWMESSAFEGALGSHLLLPGPEGEAAGALFGTGSEKGYGAGLAAGSLAAHLPDGLWRLASTDRVSEEAAALGLRLGAYDFRRYRRQAAKPDRAIRLLLSDMAACERVTRLAGAVEMVRDLINTPTNDLGPAELAQAARDLAERHGASFAEIVGDDLLAQNFPAIHAVGRASAGAPRLIDLRWGDEDAPKVTLVGKGVCFDTGGLDIKPASSMKLMKKDMGGAANSLGLAALIMGAKLPVRLRVLIPAVENSISANAFRPSDVIATRKGLSVEIGNTDAEGRLILADALAYGDEEEPELMIDMATLTGAARAALGPDVAPFYTDDGPLAAELSAASDRLADPIWRMPLYRPYAKKLASKVADTNNITSDAFAGSVTAALFLNKFTEKAKSWAHFDIYGWNADRKPHSPVGGEAQAIRTIAAVLEERYPARNG